MFNLIDQRNIFNFILYHFILLSLYNWVKKTPICANRTLSLYENYNHYKFRCAALHMKEN